MVAFALALARARATRMGTILSSAAVVRQLLVPCGRGRPPDGQCAWPSARRPSARSDSIRVRFRRHVASHVSLDPSPRPYHDWCQQHLGHRPRRTLADCGRRTAHRHLGALRWPPRRSDRPPRWPGRETRRTASCTRSGSPAPCSSPSAASLPPSRLSPAAWIASVTVLGAAVMFWLVAAWRLRVDNCHALTDAQASIAAPHVAADPARLAEHQWDLQRYERQLSWTWCLRHAFNSRDRARADAERALGKRPMVS